MSTAEKVADILREAQVAPVALAIADVRTSLQRWRECYSGEVHAQTGKWRLGEFEWHVFSFGKCVHKQGDRAWSAFRRVAPGPFLVLSAWTRETFGFRCDGVPPDGLDCGVDVLIAPPLMEWTMAFNHERYGPYFALTR